MLRQIRTKAVVRKKKSKIRSLVKNVKMLKTIATAMTQKHAKPISRHVRLLSGITVIK